MNHSPFSVVFADNDNRLRRHPNVSAAREEAVRLAQQAPGNTFHVVTVTASVSARKPVDIVEYSIDSLIQF